MITRVTDASSAVDHLAAAEEARSKDLNGYHALLGEHFGTITGTNPLYDVLMRVRFKGFVTPNFDPLLAHEARKPEHKCKVTWYPDVDRAALRDRVVFYIHGLINEGQVPEPGEIVLSQSEFDQAYNSPDSMLDAFMLQTFAKDPLCFVGCRLTEPPLEPIFERCRRVQARISGSGGGAPPPKFIVLPERRIQAKLPDGSIVRDLAAEATSDMNEAERYGSLGLQIVRYDPIDRSHSGLRRLFEPLTNLGAVPQIFGFGGSAP